MAVLTDHAAWLQVFGSEMHNLLYCPNIVRLRIREAEDDASGNFIIQVVAIGLLRSKITTAGEQLL